MNHSHTIYFVDSDNDTRVKLLEIAKQAHVRLEIFSHGKSFLKAFDRGPGCLVADLQLEDMSGLEIQLQLAQLGCKLPVIFVTAHAEIALVVKAMQNGAATVLQKPVSDHEICDAVTKALARDSETRRVDARHAELQTRVKRLTPKERDVLGLIMAGVPNKLIAHRLDISLRTVEARRQRIFQKTKCKTLADLMRLAIHVELESTD